MEDLIRVAGLCKQFRDFSLQNVALRVPRGSVVGFIGENGAGKSTTLKCILGLVNPDGGAVEVFGKPVSALTKIDRCGIGAVLGESCLPANLDLKDVDSVMKRVFSRWDSAAFFGYTDRFSLPRDKKIREFSRGMQQKTSLAVALSHGARLLVLDEPTSGLDPVARDEILDLLYDFMQDEGHSVLISSHILSDLEKLCDYIAFIHGGRIVLEEEKDTLTEKYGVLRCTEEELSALDPAAVVAVRRGEYGVDALVLRGRLPAGVSPARASVEDIMLYFSRGEHL